MSSIQTFSGASSYLESPFSEAPASFSLKPHDSPAQPTLILFIKHFAPKYKFNTFDIIYVLSAALETTLNMVLMKDNPYGIFFSSLNKPDSYPGLHGLKPEKQVTTKNRTATLYIVILGPSLLSLYYPFFLMSIKLLSFVIINISSIMCELFR